MRPAGGWLMGRYADKHGRRAALTLSVLLMCGGSLLIAVTPSYAKIGLIAPAMLVLARLLQGLSVGGEYGASATYLSEMAGKTHRGFWSSFQYVTLIMGQLLALAMLLLLQRTMAPADLESWGWRIPFIVGAALAVVAVAMPLVQLIDKRNKRGQGDGLRNNRHILCNNRVAIRLLAMSRRRAKNKNCPATNAAGLRRSLLAVDGDAIKLHTVINQSISKPLSDNLLQCLKLRVDEFDDLAGFDIDQMVMMRFRRCFITGAAVTEIVAVQYPCLFEKADSAVYGGNRNFGVDCR